jgi:glycosidase
VNKEWYTQDGNGNIIHPPGTNWMDVADLNFDNEQMRLAMIEAMKFWAEEVGVDGFRCDAADFVPFEFWKQALDSLGSDLVLLAEGSRANHFTAGFQLNYAWDFYGRIKGVFAGTYPASSIFTTHYDEANTVPAGARKLRFTTNHDETAWDAPPPQLFGGVQGALAASVITMYMGGVPLLYNGQEVGLDVNLPFFSNYPIDWSLNPGMAAEYRRLIQLYKSSDALKKGQLATFPDPNIVAYQRTRDSETVVVVVNVKNEVKDWPVPAALQNSSWKNALTGEAKTLQASETLPPYGYFILKNE